MDKKPLNPEELENVTGGVMRTVDTKMALEAVVRGGPGTQYSQVGSLTNGTQVNTTGNTSYNSMDGRTWYEKLSNVRMDGRKFVRVLLMNSNTLSAAYFWLINILTECHCLLNTIDHLHLSLQLRNVCFSLHFAANQIKCA